MYNEKGSALIFTLMVILILTILGVAILEVSLSEYKISAAYTNSVSANYAAEAGLDAVKGEFNKSLLDALSNGAQNIIDNTKGMISQEDLYQRIYSYVQSYLQNNVFNKYLDKSFDLGDSGQSYSIDGISLDPYTAGMGLKYTIKVSTIGRCKNIIHHGYAEFILDLGATGNPITINKWTIGQ